MTLVMTVLAVTEVLQMMDPKITQYARPLSESDRDEIGDINFEDFDYMLGVSVDVLNWVSIIAGGTIITELPPEVGHMVAKVKYDDESMLFMREVPLVECAQFLSKETIDRSVYEIRQKLLDGQIKCIDPRSATLRNYRDKISSNSKKIEFIFERC